MKKGVSVIRDRRVALAFRVFSIVFILVGLIDETNVLEGNLNPGVMLYYTIQSNILGLILFALLAFKTWKALRHDGPIGKTGFFPRFEMVCVIDLLLTLVVFWVLLAPRSFTMDGEYNLWTFSNFAVHLVTPLLCLVDYVLFAETKHLKYRDVYAVLIFPLLYVVFSSLLGLTGYEYRISADDGLPVHYPYFFFDYDRVGVMSLAYMGVLVAFFLVLSHLLYLVDRVWKKPQLFTRKK